MKDIKIIVCDDNQDNMDILKILLELGGYSVITENDSTLLMQRIKEECPDILILDLWMPNLCGDEIIKIIRSDVNLKELPIIVVSASQDGENVAIGTGADYYLGKPFDIDMLIKIIKTISTTLL
ncbi:response regulator [Chryseobacterium takakiae]|uniref:Response regulator receiver domain-containing protein n=1 Tax=Chryseobacterium takakiae TaxID=1302685 RepID=A0A1M5ASL0_9FLAO|nr:response regulator [Chryseobacterium takakiae]SHF33248.1 Response regulator receiver domain-containing protein [Chryseobacterium takakiae]